ncbi:hypothetical protein ATCC90586_005710 [Pythium insidiosum]|nr:hypothetical protein ATCC90586_005710 [Pythium insidiosum]
MSAASARRSSRAQAHGVVSNDANGGASTPPTARGNKKPADFMFGATLGEGAYARVVHARMKETGAEYAIKIMEKRFIMKEDKVKFVMMERKVFTQLASERIVKLFYTFHDDNYLYFVMELCRGGELLDVITKHQKEQAALGVQDRACSLELTRFYIAEVVQALEYLHAKGFIHRDLKPENILLSESGHIKVTDFGTAKDENEEHRSNTFCGTAEFVSPEVLRDHEASRGCDLWALACMVFQMLVGRPLFRAENEYLTFQQILNHPSEDFRYPDGFPDVARDLIDKILLQEPSERLGAGTDDEGNGYRALKAHPFFDGVDWDRVGSTPAPYRPTIPKLPPTDNDGATEDWLLAGVATELHVSSGLDLEPAVQYAREISPSPVTVLEVARQRAAAPPPPVMTRANSLWNRFLLDDELINMGALISKRRGLFSKKRQLILTSKPRLIYIDPVKMRQKGEIPWSQFLYVQSKSSTAFDVVTPNRVYHLSDAVNGARKWIDAINAALVWGTGDDHGRGAMASQQQGSADAVSRSSKKPSPADFMFGTTLGEGAYARVVHARMKETGVEYAVKIMEKRFIKKEKKVKFVMMERKVFSKVSHDRIVKLYFTFQDNNYLYMVMELCRGGELLDVITKHQKEQSARGIKDRACSLELTRFYIAEVVVALEYLHNSGVIHRDLKPENILLSESGHIKVTDFGTAKDENEEHRSNTFCGTAEFVSPEVLRDHEASRGCDLWALACMVFQMLVGRPLFRAENEYLTFQQILNHPSEDFRYPDGFPDVARDLIDKILLQEPSERLGAGTDDEGNGYRALKAHPFFDGVDWDRVGSTPAPYRPTIPKLPPTDNDGATEDWLFAGVATELQVSSGLVFDSMAQGAAAPGSPRDVLEVARQKAAVPPPPPITRTTSLWNRFLLDDEMIKMGGLISKRKGLFSKKRQLILTSRPRLIYIDPIRMRQKGEIPWSSNLYVTTKSATAFDVVTPNRVYHLNDVVNGSKQWIDAINSALVGRTHWLLYAE